MAGHAAQIIVDVYGHSVAFAPEDLPYRLLANPIGAAFKLAYGGPVRRIQQAGMI
jgi:hypothetical protein